MRKNRYRLERYLDDFKKRFEPFLERYLKKKVIALRKVNAMAFVTGKVISDFTMRGGKRIRAALVDIGYKSVDGRDTERILLAAVAFELMHSFFLIHDDIIDRSDLRRSKPTVHRIFQEIYRQMLEELSPEEQEHFVNSMAMLAGDLCCAMAYEALSESDFTPELVLKAIRHMRSLMETTVVGEALDILAPLEATFAEARAMKIGLLKTARYTLEGPLLLGMILAGAGEKMLSQISGYAIPVGMAFQIQDDILGVFGSEKELGKPVTSDIEEGKKTLLTVFVRRRGGRHWQRLSSLLGKGDITVGELQEVRAIIKKSGALAYAEQAASDLVAKGKRALDHIDLPREVKTLLRELADYIVARTA